MGFFFLLLHGEANDENRSKERRIPHYIPLETIFSGWGSVDRPSLHHLQPSVATGRTEGETERSEGTVQ